MIYTAHYTSLLGEILLAEQDGKLIGLWLEGQKHGLSVLKGGFTARETALLTQTRDWLDRYFAGARPGCDALPLAPEGNLFRQTVWQLLREIPYGQVVTYKAIAEETAQRLGKPRMSAQAIGGAIGHNPIAIVIPCHRVIGTTGSLTGYDGGIHLKQALLTHEGIDLSAGRRQNNSFR